MFEKLRKKYSKKKNAWKSANKSGTSTGALDEVKREFEKYSFLHDMKILFVRESQKTI